MTDETETIFLVGESNNPKFALIVPKENKLQYLIKAKRIINLNIKWTKEELQKTLVTEGSS